MFFRTRAKHEFGFTFAGKRLGVHNFLLKRTWQCKVILGGYLRASNARSLTQAPLVKYLARLLKPLASMGSGPVAQPSRLFGRLVGRK